MPMQVKKFKKLRNNEVVDLDAMSYEVPKTLDFFLFISK